MNPTLIMGAGRSGTTILKKVLARHSEVVALRDELRIISDLDGMLDLICCIGTGWSRYNEIHSFFRSSLSCGLEVSSRQNEFFTKKERQFQRISSLRYGVYPSRLNQVLWGRSD